MNPKYLVRFDDICPHMNWEIWDIIEKILIEKKIKPILAIIPDNQDETLKPNKENFHFWDRVRGWQALGWTIGLHGYQHILEEIEYGIVPISKKTEFVGSSFEDQKKKIFSGLDLMKKESIHASTWVAPAHSFDENTLLALDSANIKIISDGFHITPYVDHNEFFWIPQQLWKFRKMIFGVWTVCYHHNNWKDKDIRKFQNDVKLYEESIVCLDDLLNLYSNRQPSFIDKVFPLIHTILLKIKKIIRTITKGLR